MDKITENWMQRSKYDLDTAGAMFKSRRYLYVGFMCQQAIEKILKAIIIYNGGKVLRIHNLVRLAELAKVYHQIANKDQEFLANLTPFAVEARYGEYKENLSEIMNKKKADEYIEKTKELYKCLRKEIKK
jgi:HEPN domain-containing protein